VKRSLLNSLIVVVFLAGAQFVRPARLAAECEISQSQQNACNLAASNDYSARFNNCLMGGTDGWYQTSYSCSYDSECQFDGYATSYGYCYTN